MRLTRQTRICHLLGCIFIIQSGEPWRWPTFFRVNSRQSKFNESRQRMYSEKRESIKLTAIKINDSELATWHTARDDCFDWVKRLIHLLPRGKGWASRKLGKTVFKNTKGLISMPSGVRLAVAPKSLDAYVSRSMAPGCVVTEMCQKTLYSGNVFFDIGANIGSVSLAVAQAFEDQVHIYAFEPQATIAKCISISSALNGFNNVFVYQTLVGEYDGEADLFVGDVSTLASLSYSEQVSKKVRCRMISIDHQIQLGALPPPNVIKIDVEGAEFCVLKGMEYLIRTHTPIIILEADEKMNSFSTTPTQLTEYLKSLADYDFYLLHPDPTRKKRIRRVESLADSDGGNFLVAPTKDLETKNRLSQ